MSNNGPKPNNPLSPYYPSEVPSLSGNARLWFVLLIVAMLLVTAGFSALTFIFSLL